MQKEDELFLNYVIEMHKLSDDQIEHAKKEMRRLEKDNFTPTISAILYGMKCLSMEEIRDIYSHISDAPFQEIKETAERWELGIMPIHQYKEKKTASKNKSTKTNKSKKQEKTTVENKEENETKKALDNLASLFDEHDDSNKQENNKLEQEENETKKALDSLASLFNDTPKSNTAQQEDKLKQEENETKKALDNLASLFDEHKDTKIEHSQESVKTEVAKEKVKSTSKNKKQADSPAQQKIEPIESATYATMIEKIDTLLENMQSFSMGTNKDSNTSSNKVKISWEEACNYLKDGQTIQNAYITDLCIQDSTITYPVILQDCILVDVILDDVVFACTVDFSNTQFLGKATFRKTQFADASFSKAEFVDGADFTKAHFTADVHFHTTNFRKFVTFNRAIFDDKAVFTRTRFERGAKFNESLFYNITSFNDITCEHRFYMDNCTFEHEISFSNAVFDNIAEFNGSQFKNVTKFKGTKFNQWASFNDSTIEDDFILRNTSISGDLTFNSAIIKGTVDFTSICAEKNVNFKDTKIENDAQFYFLDAYLGRLFMTIAQLNGHLGNHINKKYNIAYKEYGLLKNNFREINEYTSEDWAYLWEKRMARYSYSRHNIYGQLKRFFDWLILDLTCGYGTKPINILLTSLVSIFFFSLIYYWGGSQFNIPEELQQKELSVAILPTREHNLEQIVNQAPEQETKEQVEVKEKLALENKTQDIQQEQSKNEEQVEVEEKLAIENETQDIQQEQSKNEEQATNEKQVVNIQQNIVNQEGDPAKNELIQPKQIKTIPFMDALQVSFSIFTNSSITVWTAKAQSWINYILMIESFIGLFTMTVLVLTFSRKVIR